MRKLTILAAMTAATALTTPAYAGNPEGNIQIKVLGTAVLPNGELKDVNVDLIGLPPGSQTKVNDNVVPTLAAEYFFNKNVSVETICCFTQHHASGTGTLAGAELIDHILILPATLTVKYHIDAGAGIKPYIGAGPSVFFIFGEKPGATAEALGADTVKMSNEFGFVLQAGVDIPINDSGMGISLDAKRYWIRPSASFYTAGGVKALETEHKLDPWVLSGGVYFRF